MTRSACQGIAALAVACILMVSSMSSAVERVELAPGDVISRSGGGFSYTLELVSPLVQTHPTLDFTGPYYYLVLTNTAAVEDDFFLTVENLDQPTWFPQVCIQQICFPFSTTLTFAAGESDTVGVNVVPFEDNVGEWDFELNSVGNPALNDQYHMVLYAGTAATGVNGLSASEGFVLDQNFPNPAPGRTSISFTLPRTENVTLGVYDVAGRLVTRLAEGPLSAGPHTVNWDGMRSGTPAPNGVYFYRLATPTGELSRSLTLLR
jgi:hypothetical protein